MFLWAAESAVPQLFQKIFYRPDFDTVIGHAWGFVVGNADSMSVGMFLPKCPEPLEMSVLSLLARLDFYGKTDFMTIRVE